MLMLPYWLGLYHSSSTRLRGGGKKGSPTPSTGTQSSGDSEDSAMQHFVEENIEKTPVDKETPDLMSDEVGEPSSYFLKDLHPLEAQRERRIEESRRERLLEEARENKSRMTAWKSKSVTEAKQKLEAQMATSVSASGPPQEDTWSTWRGPGSIQYIRHPVTQHLEPVSALHGSAVDPSRTLADDMVHDLRQTHQHIGRRTAMRERDAPYIPPRFTIAPGMYGTRYPDSISPVTPIVPAPPVTTTIPVFTRPTPAAPTLLQPQNEDLWETEGVPAVTPEQAQSMALQWALTHNPFDELSLLRRTVMRTFGLRDTEYTTWLQEQERRFQMEDMPRPQDG